MRYLSTWFAAIVVGILFFREYFWISIVIMFVLHIVNYRQCGEFTKYAMTTFFPIVTTQIISATLGKRLTHAYSVWIVPILERSGILVSESWGEQVPFIVAVLLFLVMEVFSMWWVNVPIRRNRSSFMRNTIRSNGFQTFSNQMSNMLRSLNEETQWDTKDFIRLNAEVDILCDNKARPKTKDLLSALQQSPEKNNITLVIGEPGSGKSVAMRGLCAALLKKCQKTRRIPLYVNLKHWNKNWESGLYPSQKDLRSFILDSYDQYAVDHFLRNNFDNIMENGGWFFILDSYDEIPFLADKNRIYNSHVSKVIYDFLSNSGGVLASRPFRSPDADPERVGNHFRILPFNEGQLIQFFQRDVGLSKAACRALFEERPDIVDLSRTPLLASLVWQYYREKQVWPANQRNLYQELMTVRIRSTLDESGDRSGITPELIMKMAATLACKMMETESSHSFLTLKEAHVALPYPSCQIDTVAGILEAAKICKLNGANREMITFVHRRFMEFFVTQSSQFSQQTVRDHLSDLWTLGSYYDVLALYGEICEPDAANTLAEACHQVIMKPGNDFQNIRNENCLYAINSLNFLFNAFRRKPEPMKPYITAISDKVLEALEAGCRDNACLAVFATVVPLLSPQCQEDILVTLLTFKYKWISQYLSRIFYRDGRNSEALLLAYIENLNSYQDLTFLWELPVFLFVFAKEKSLRQYCFLRVMDTMLAVFVAAMLGGYAIRLFFSDQLPFTFRDPLTLIVWFQSLPLSNQIIIVVSAILILIYGIWFANNVSIMRMILLMSAWLVGMVTDFSPPIQIAYSYLSLLLALFKLPDIVALKLKFRKAKRKLKVIGGFLLMIVLGVIGLILYVAGIKWLGGHPYLFIGYLILMLLFFILSYIEPARLILDITRLQKALRELDECGGTLPRQRLEQILYGIRGKRSRAKLIVRLSRMNIQLTGNWTHASRPIIGMEREDQLLTALDTKDLPLAR